MNETLTEVVMSYYRAHARPMPWREQPSLYYVLVSELMLQQTQVPRVLKKFDTFITQFPTVEALAAASLADVIVAWQGLGYNRRAKFLWLAAQQIVAIGAPTTKEEFVALPGVGPHTAGALMNYVYNQPTPFVETNIRTVYQFFYAAEGERLSDAQIYQLVAETIPMTIEPRIWFWALMDYGTYLKSRGHGHGLANRQSRFEGSGRQMRGRIVKVLTAGQYTLDELRQAVDADERFDAALTGLLADGLIRNTNGIYHLTK